MRLIADGVTPNERLVLANELETDDGLTFVLDRPLFLLVGDRLDLENRDPVVLRASGGRFTPPGSWERRCYSWRLK
ncbi:hypothetical protein [Kutzneria chonburiensis]|uniref:Uncharacterized protein n=1 Tax=Kutzneria chonburiensis TaxID=1483604 RepID=A0ABV6MPK7_9PSEU|nr:hypothetical protein [Kutzneria chonburiensis]